MYPDLNYLMGLLRMALTIEDIKAMLADGKIKPCLTDVIANGTLKGADGITIKYNTHSGWDIAKAYACDNEWGAFNVSILAHIASNYKDKKSVDAALENTSLEDYHWEWFKKSAAFRTEQYRWYFMIANDKIQAACLIFQPKTSAFQEGNIFYVEYIAVAPWNRPNPMQERLCFGVGTTILRNAVEHCMITLNLKPGFSLHALPKAIPFYEKIGMLPHPPMDKDQLPYFEMPESAFKTFAI